jgi:glycerate kinase
MKKFVLIPDSFKGTMSSIEICGIMRQAILKHCPDAEIVAIPVADGGEGSVDSFLQALEGRRVTAAVQNPFGEPMEAYYGLIDGGKTAVIEMASCAGLPLAEDRKNPLITTTFGVGELILHAAQNGAKKIIMGLGGSATNDGGCGAASAAGVRFYGNDGGPFVPVGGTLKGIARIDISGRHEVLNGVEFVTMCDIDNPMFGPDGAARIFGPQKGASAKIIELLDNGVKHLSSVIARDLGQDLSLLPGSGAAGAMGAGMVAFFGSSLQMGIETVLDTVRFDDAIKNADMIFTGEGKLDEQSLRGKVVIGVAGRAKRAGVPVIAIVGDIGDNVESAYAAGVSAIFSINRVAKDFSIIRRHARHDMELTVDNLMRFLRQMGSKAGQ